MKLINFIKKNCYKNIYSHLENDNGLKFIKFYHDGEISKVYLPITNHQNIVEVRAIKGTQQVNITTINELGYSSAKSLGCDKLLLITDEDEKLVDEL